MAAVTSTDEGDASRSRLMIKYNARPFYDVNRIPELHHEGMQSGKLCDVRTNTLLVMEVPLRQSDDGPFIDGAWSQEG